jgi:predicted dehydrogenase
MSARTDAPIRVGIIGTGAWATQAHIPGFAACPGVAVVAICSRSQERGADVARSFGIPRVYTSVQELIAAGELDLVSIVTPDDCHFAEASAAVAAGLHVLCEKPLARTLGEALALTQAARRAGVLTKVGFTLRYAPAVMRLRELLADGTIGTPYLMELFLQNGQFLNPGVPRHWKMTREHAGGGAVVEYGIHGFDLARSLFGDVTRVCAAGRTFIPERPLAAGPGMTNVDIDDSSVWLMNFANGALGVAHAGWATVGRPPGLDLRLFGSQGALRCVLSDDLPGCESLSIANAQDQRFEQVEIPARLQPPLPPNTPWPLRFHHNLIRHFVEEVRSRTRREPAFEDGANAQALLEAALLSMDEARWVTVPPPLSAATGV